MSKHRPWTGEEILFLKKNYKSHSDLQKCIDFTGRSKAAVRHEISRQGLGISCKKEFTDEQISWLKRNYLKHTNEHLAYKLGVSVSLVKRTLYKMGKRRCSLKKVLWTKKEDKILIDNYATMLNKDIAFLINEAYRQPGKRTNKAVAERLKVLGIERTVEQLKLLKEQHMQRIEKYRFDVSDINKRTDTNREKAASTLLKNAMKDSKTFFNELQNRRKFVNYKPLL